VAESLQPGVNLVGVLSSGTGIGAAGRASLAVLDRQAIPHAAVDIGAGNLAVREHLAETTPRLASLADMPFGATVIQMNPDMFDVLVLRWARRLGYDMAPTVNAIVPFWELPTLPSAWTPPLLSFDVALAPSLFVREAIERSLPEQMRPVVLDYPQAVQPPDGVVPDRERWLGARAQTLAILCTFDVLSDIERKNPWASVGAFQKAFAGSDDATLVIKVNNARSPAHGDQVARLNMLVAEDRRILLVDEFLDRADLWGLYVSTDVYLSLHRSEGLGLGLMEAMAVGKPVVATAWSGNADFMDESNSMPVPFRLVPVSEVTHASYRGETAQKWADPDVGAAASAIRALADDHGLRTRLGNRAAESMRMRLRLQTGSRVFDALIDMATSGLAATGDHRERVESARRYARSKRGEEAVSASRRAVIRALRAVGLRPPTPVGEQEWPPKILT
jgi:hypothetical protein